MPDILIDLYTDISCPWCLIGQHRLDKVLAERFPALSVDIVHYPVFLLPDCPAEGVVVADMLRERYGVTDPAQAWARPEAEARSSGLDLDLSRQRFAYPTQAAQTLVRLARERGTQHRLAVALARSYFLEVRNIADLDVLADIASKHSFDPAEARAFAAAPDELARTERQAEQSAARGVRSVPHFIFPGRVSLIGGRGEDELAQAIEQAILAMAESRS